MFNEYDVKRLYEYLGQYAKTLVVCDDSDSASGMLIEGAARFVAFVEEDINTETSNHKD